MARYGREYGGRNRGMDRGGYSGGQNFGGMFDPRYGTGNYGQQGRGGGVDRGGYHPGHGAFNDEPEWGDRQMQGRGGRGRGTGGMRASEIMTENPEVVTPEATVADAAKRMKELNVGIIPVVESEQSRRLKGVVTDRDLAIRVLAEGKDAKAKVGDCMTSDVETVNKNDSVRDVLRVMEREQVRRVPVVDRENRLVGIIAQADLAVEYAEDDREREVRVEEAIERISEPARPNRDRGGWR
jgi:CBS domain-containing protein